MKARNRAWTFRVAVTFLLAAACAEVPPPSPTSESPLYDRLQLANITFGSSQGQGVDRLVIWGQLNNVGVTEVDHPFTMKITVADGNWRTLDTGSTTFPGMLLDASSHFEIICDTAHERRDVFIAVADLPQIARPSGVALTDSIPTGDRESSVPLGRIVNWDRSFTE